MKSGNRSFKSQTGERPHRNSLSAAGSLCSRGDRAGGRDRGRGMAIQRAGSWMPLVAKSRNMVSIRWGDSFAPPSSHQVKTAM
jgi:hypothetical protein